jgi:hypothetical protein
MILTAQSFPFAEQNRVDPHTARGIRIAIGISSGPFVAIGESRISPTAIEADRS